MTQIAQAYLHNHHTPSEASLNEWGRIAERLSYGIAKATFPTDVEIIVHLEPGSLKTRINVILAGALAVYAATADYSDFKRGLAEMMRDAREFAGTFNSQFIEAVGIPQKDIVRKERRTETPGRILRALNRLEDFEHRISEKHPEMTQEFRQIVRQLQLGLSDLSPEERDSAVDAIEAEHRQRLPKSLVPRLALRVPEYVLGNDEYPVFAIEGDRPRLSFFSHVRTDQPLDDKLRLTLQQK